MKSSQVFAFVMLVASPIVSSMLCVGDARGSDSNSAVAVEAWKAASHSNRPSKAGCYSIAYPSSAWTEVPCAKSPDAAVVGVAPAAAGIVAGASAGIGGQVGNGNDFIATVSGTTISQVEEVFPSTPNLTSETDLETGNSDMYDLQINSNFFGNIPACNGYPNCVGWQQFEYSSRQFGGVFVEYWMFNYGNNNCPSGWGQWDATTCHTFSTISPVPLVPVVDLQTTQLYAWANRTDGVELFVGSTNTGYSVVTDPNMLNLGFGWTNAEVNIFGDLNAHEAIVNTGAAIQVQANIWREDAASTAPGCTAGGTTGETNNLTLPPLSACTTAAGIPSFIEFTEAVDPSGCTSPIFLSTTGTYALSNTGSSCYAVPKSLVHSNFAWGCTNCGTTTTVVVDHHTVKIGATPLPVVWPNSYYYFVFSKAPHSNSTWNFRN